MSEADISAFLRLPLEFRQIVVVVVVLVLSCCRFLFMTLAARQHVACLGHCNGGTINGRLSSHEILAHSAPIVNDGCASPRVGEGPALPRRRSCSNYFIIFVLKLYVCFGAILMYCAWPCASVYKHNDCMTRFSVTFISFMLNSCHINIFTRCETLCLTIGLSCT